MHKFKKIINRVPEIYLKSTNKYPNVSKPIKTRPNVCKIQKNTIKYQKCQIVPNKYQKLEKYSKNILRSEDQNNSLNISDIVEERELDDGNTITFNSGNPCPLCQNDNDFCCCGVCDECEYMNTEEGMNTHIMNQHEPSDVVKGLGQQWAKDRLSFIHRNPDIATDQWQSAKWDKLYL